MNRMRTKSLWKDMAAGLAAGAVVGTAGLLLSNAALTRKSKLKLRTAKAIHALSDVMDSVTELWR